MIESSRAQALPGSRMFEDQPIGTERRPRVVEKTMSSEAGLALLPKIASQLALLNLMGGTVSHPRRAVPSRRTGFNGRTSGPRSRSVRCDR